MLAEFCVQIVGLFANIRHLTNLQYAELLIDDMDPKRMPHDLAPWTVIYQPANGGFEPRASGRQISLTPVRNVFALNNICCQGSHRETCVLDHAPPETCHLIRHFCLEHQVRLKR